MRYDTNYLYLDYLDYSVGSRSGGGLSPSERLRFDLLLFPQQVFCLSVPACVKLESTTMLLMKLTPFWAEGRIRLILSSEHSLIPRNYFRKRIGILEKAFSEGDLVRHFEFKAYNSDRTNVFYNTYLPEIAMPRGRLYIPKVDDTGLSFRTASISLATNIAAELIPRLPIRDAIRAGSALEGLIDRASDTGLLFQRAAVLEWLKDVWGVSSMELVRIASVLDRCFAYANAISAAAVPVSLVRNRFTAVTFVPFIESVAPGMRRKVNDLGWSEIHQLSTAPIWLDFLDRINSLLILRRKARGLREFLPNVIARHMSAERMARALTALVEGSATEALLEAGMPHVSLSDYAQHLNDVARASAAGHLSMYADAIGGVNDSLLAIDRTLDAMKRTRRLTTARIGREGFEVNLLPDS